MVIGKYQLLRKLATGGMAEVFLAKAAGPMGFEKTLVLKRILPHLAEDPRFVEMFHAEAKLAAQLNHPYIIQIFDFGEEEGTYYLAMEYIDGPNLRLLAKRARKLGMSLSPALCARIIAHACEGLAFAHDASDPATGQPLGLVHRDISPDNLLLSRQGAVKVVDFGIAKAAGQRHLTQTGQLKGKLSYMAPEQLQGKPLDRRVDVYALGIVFYELLTGRKPFEAITIESLANAILFEPGVPAVQHRPDLPEAVQRILDRALARDREQRYPDCRAFQADLEEFILSTGKPLGAYQLSQLVLQVTANVDTPTPTPTPLPASPSHGLAASPAWTGARGTSTPRPVLRPSGAPETAELLEPTLLSPSPAVTATPSRSTPPPQETRVEKVASVSRRQQGGWIPALVGVMLLAAGGGYVLARTLQQSPRPSPPQLLEAYPAVPEPLVPTSAVENMNLGSPGLIVPDMGDRQQPPSEEPSIEDPGKARPEERPATSSTGRRPAPRLDTGRAGEASAPRMGTLRLVVRGWADIWVDGQKVGRVPPLNELELTAGRHELELVNPAAAKPYRAVITITAGKTLEHRVSLQAASVSR